MEVSAFTQINDAGDAGPAELSEKIEIGDKVMQVNGVSCRGKDYGGVLDMIIGAERPLTIVFERKPGETREKQRVLHRQWSGEK